MASIEDHMQRPATVDNGFQAIAAICLRYHLCSCLVPEIRRFLGDYTKIQLFQTTRELRTGFGVRRSSTYYHSSV